MKRRCNIAILPKIATLVGGALLGSLLYAPLAFAETKIHEVQPWPNDGPTQLIIWGTDFGPVNWGDGVPADDSEPADSESQEAPAEEDPFTDDPFDFG